MPPATATRHDPKAGAEIVANGHHFEGFFDELEIFGTETYREWRTLAKAAHRGRDVQYHLEFEPAEKRELVGAGAE